MFLRLLKKIYQQLILLVVVALVLVAAYVSLGRQFMPAISAYSDFLEEQIYASTGLAVNIESLSGEFQGFNPVINISGLSLLVGEDAVVAEQSAPLNFDRAMIVVDVMRSIWQRRWVLDEFLVERLALSVVQDESGSWQLGSVAASEAGTIRPADLYQALQRVTRLDLREVVVDVENRQGDSSRFSNGTATIQNRGNEHFFHVDTTHAESGQNLRLSFEVTGNNIEALSGSLHVSVPVADYSNILQSLELPQVTVQEFLGGGDFWLQWRDGSILQSVASLDVESFALETSQGGQLSLEAIRGNARLRRQNPATEAANTLQPSAWSLSLSQMTLTLDDFYWRPFNLHVNYVPQRSVAVRADSINLALLAEAALQSGLLNDDARTQLLGYSPSGSLDNFNLNFPLRASDNQVLTVRGNLDNVELGSVRGSPNMWGINGFFEARFDRNANLIQGEVAVESDNFSINIPNVFTRVWDYDYVNGAIDYEVDLNNGQKVTLRSGVIVAESAAVDGHVQFRSILDQPPVGDRESELDLIIGASRFDAEYKSLYLPDGPGIAPNLRATMEYLESAIIDGEVFDSAVIFRGNTKPGSEPASKTFQSFYRLANGEFEFNEQWPRLLDLTGAVLTSDNDIDIAVSAGESLALTIDETSGQVRRNEQEETWLAVRGRAHGATDVGLDYIQAAPLSASLKRTFSDWRAQGNFDSTIEVFVPLNLPGREPDIRLDIDVAQNDLRIENLQLDVANINGRVLFDTRTGLEPTELSADFFGDTVAINLSSEFAGERLASLLVDVAGRTTPELLIEWPRQSEFVRDLLRQADGDFAYQAQLAIDQTGEQQAGIRLALTTDFTGTGFTLPQPFAKLDTEPMPLQVDIAFAEAAQRIEGTLGEQLSFRLDLDSDGLQDGLVFIGEDREQFAALADNETNGLAIVGSVAALELEPWTRFLAQLGATGEAASGFTSNIAFIDVLAESFNLYGRAIPNVALRIEPNEELQGWWTRLNGDALSGEVVIPFDASNYLLIDLDYLRLPGDEATEETEQVAETAAAQATGLVSDEEEERVDALADIDPRALPPMRFSTGEFSIGERQFGSWRFTLNPNSTGAEFDDLNFDFRGLRLGLDEIDEDIESLPAHFTWYYDGVEHRSELSGVLTASDIGEVLLANGFAASLVSDRATFVSDVSWPGSPVFFSGDHLSGRLDMLIQDGRFLQDSGGGGALKLVSIINFSAIMRRLRFSDDLLRRGLAFDEITGKMLLDDGAVTIQDRLVISGPSSLYQITGNLNLADETIAGEMFVTLPVSDNIPWLGLLTANLPLAVGAYLFDQIFGDQVDSLTSAVYTLQGPWEGLQPEFKQAFGTPDVPVNAQPGPAVPANPSVQ